MSSWKDFPRTSNKLAIVGFAPQTRDMAPWKSEEHDFWGVNEEYNYEWWKRMDEKVRWWQLHPRWDWSRPNNMNHYNHFNWLLCREGRCMRCHGEGVLINTATQEKTECPECKVGIYKPPAYRENMILYAQKYFEDVRGCVEFPLQEASNILPFNGRPYFTSSVSFMLILAYMMEYPRVELYGFEMGTKTEYHYQRANAEFLMGLLIAKGVDVYVPPQSSLLKGELYAYKNMKTGFRQNLEMRKQILEVQERMAADKFQQYSGAIVELQQLVGKYPEIQDVLDKKNQEYARVIGTHNVVKGAMTEVENLTNLYDNYFLSGVEDEQPKSVEEFTKYTNASYLGESNAQTQEG